MWPGCMGLLRIKHRSSNDHFTRKLPQDSCVRRVWIGFTAPRKSHVTRMADEAKIREIFKRFDRDGSGEISARELVEVLRETDRIQNPNRDEAERDTIVKKKASFILVRCDKNDDMKLSWDEFYGTLKACVD